MRHLLVGKIAWKACQAMDCSYYFRPLDPSAKKGYLEKLACVLLFIKDNPTGIALVKAQTVAALLDEGARIFDFSCSPMKRTFLGAGNYLLVHL